MEPETPATDVPSRPPRPDRLADWLGAAQAMANSYHLEDIADEFRRRAERRGQPNFRVAFVGEPTRGKSTLINQLLGMEILPTGQIPTTSTAVSLLADSTTRLSVSRPGHQPQTLPAEAESWADLIRVDVSGLKGVRVRAFVDNEWLASTDAELVDTPGIDSVVGDRAIVVQQVVSESDVVVMAVSAASPLSVTETAFLREEVIGHHVPRTMVVVTMLDRLPAGERDETIAAVTQRVRQISQDIPVYAGPGIEGDGADAAIARLRATIGGLTGEEERASARDSQLAGQLADQLSRMVALARDGVEAAKLDAEERQAAQRDADRAAENQRLVWEELRLELEGRRIGLQRTLGETFESSRRSLVKAVRQQVDAAKDVKAWREKDLPYWLRRELGGVARELEEILHRRVAADLQWLESALERRRGGAAPAQETAGAGDRIRIAEVEPDLPQLHLRDMTRYRWFTRVGAAIGLVVSAAMFAPIGIVDSIAAGVAGERVVDRLDTGQREPIAPKIQAVVDVAMDEYERQVNARLKSIYGDAIDALVLEEQAWQTGRRQVVHRRPDDAAPDWEALAGDAEALRGEIIRSLEDAP